MSETVSESDLRHIADEVLLLFDGLPSIPIVIVENKILEPFTLAQYIHKPSPLIEISQRALDMGKEKVNQTLLHEHTHAFIHHEVGTVSDPHDIQFFRKLIKVGVSEDALNEAMAVKLYEKLELFIEIINLDIETKRKVEGAKFNTDNQHAKLIEEYGKLLPILDLLKNNDLLPIILTLNHEHALAEIERANKVVKEGRDVT